LVIPWSRRQESSPSITSTPSPKGDETSPLTHATDFQIDDIPTTQAQSTNPDPKSYTILTPSDLQLQQRHCPLCLNPRGTTEESGGTAVTECGHIFCWGCIQDWAQEKVSGVWVFGRNAMKVMVVLIVFVFVVGWLVVW
jgi:hypothetical protein